MLSYWFAFIYHNDSVKSGPVSKTVWLESRKMAEFYYYFWKEAKAEAEAKYT
jgi:hypothetical protein